MRDARAPDYEEMRDALARDWARFLAFALPDAAWLPVPNLGAGTAAFAREWELDGVILTGGGDPGDSPVRDASEASILSHALECALPVFCVCRGLQAVQRRFGGPLTACPPTEHVANAHRVTMIPSGGERVVNSYHRMGIREEDLARGALPLARTDDGWIEAAQWPDLGITGVMWHPERARPFQEADRALVRSALGLPDGCSQSVGACRPSGDPAVPRASVRSR